MISAKIADKILLVGPDYSNHRGGIGALIDVHRKQYEVFNFIPSFKSYKTKSRKAFFFFNQLFKIIFFLRDNRQIQIVHIHSAKNGSVYRKLIIAFISKYFFNKKIVNHIHTGHFKHFYDDSGWIGKKVVRFYLSLNDVTITVSDFWKSYFITSFQLSNVYKLNNMIDHAPAVDPVIKGGPVIFLFLGFITKLKGIFDLVRVVGLNKEYLIGKIKLEIAGHGNVEVLEDLVHQYQIEELVDYKGWVAGTEKERLLKNAGVYILPSYYEGLPISILEAMSFGKPVIATRVGGIPEVVESGVNGVLIDPGDMKEIFEALLYYINNPKSIHTHGYQSLEKIKDYYPAAITPKLESIYSSLLATAN